MADIWKVGQDVKADEFYKNTQKGYLYSTQGEGEDSKVTMKRVPFMSGELMAANMLTIVCNEMSKTYDQIILDQNDYLVEIDASMDEIEGLEKDLEARIKKLEAEIKELQNKKENGTITEEEDAELEAKTNELTNLKTQGDTQIGTKNDDLKKLGEKAGNAERKAKSEIATDYGNTAIEKGEPLSQTQDKRKSFWRKLAGTWNKEAYRKAGDKLIEAGNELLEQVSTSSKIYDEITNKLK